MAVVLTTHTNTYIHKYLLLSQKIRNSLKLHDQQPTKLSTNTFYVVLSGVMVSVFAIGPKARGLNPG
jgi:hypothetical protein